MALSVVILVGESQKWIPELVAKAKTLKVSGGTEKRHRRGPLISCAARDRVVGLIERGIADGATLELDGRNPSVPGYEKGNFVGPPSSAASSPACPSTTRKSLAPCCAWPLPTRWTKPLNSSTPTPTATARPSSRQSGAAARKFQEEIDVGPGRHQRANSCARAHLLVHRFARFQAGRPGPYGKQVVMFYTQTKTVTARWFDDSTVRARA